MTITKMRLSNPVAFIPNEAISGYTTPVTTFGPVPPGYVWTGSIGAVMSQQLTVGAQSAVPPGTPDNNEWLANVIWTMYRNGQAEATWVGYSQLCDVQAFDNDILTVVGRLPGIGGQGPLPAIPNTRVMQNVTISYLGYSGTEQEVPITVPFVSTSVESQPNAIVPASNPIPINALLTNPGSTTLITTGPAQLWSATICLSATTGTTLVTADAYLEDITHYQYAMATLECQGNASTAGQLAVSTTTALGGGMVDFASFPLRFTMVTSGSPGVRASCTLTYSLANTTNE